MGDQKGSFLPYVLNEIDWKPLKENSEGFWPTLHNSGNLHIADTILRTRIGVRYREALLYFKCVIHTFFL